MKILATISAVIQKLTHIALLISAAGLFFMTCIIGWQVFSRFVLNDSPAWSESLALLLMLYYIMLAAAVGVHEGFHLGLKFLIDVVPNAAKKGLERVNYILIMIFGGSMVFNGMYLIEFTAEHIVPTLNISRSIAYWPFAASGLLIVIFSLERFLITFIEKRD